MRGTRVNTQVPIEAKTPEPPALLLCDIDPLPLGVADPGVSPFAAHCDHVHEHGDLPGGTLHDEVTALDSGFMSPDMLARLDRVRQVSFPYDWASAFGSAYRCRNIATAVRYGNSCEIPIDFGQLVFFGVKFIPNGTQAGRTMNVQGEWGGPGQANNAFTNTINVVNNYTGGILTTVDLSSLFSVNPLIAGGSLGIGVQNTDGIQISMLYSVLRYYPTP